eukprot:CAMPEP_0119261832 /NCGR_PEP_ID=MMETSP1329-20130426/1753_1 /TAXON_ID=114041 /ORGANISM="Genus nov. species nov., Strain RCC1024" /LENGTH=428 /DNA_ID=CAMNT_0007261423 /DNA_START=160 /DNA_END=1443 /DNA_ORIENTATION=+
MAESSEDYAAAHALEFKERGNAAFKAGDYQGAVSAYSEAIALDPGQHVLYSNRSNVYLTMGHVSKAFKDAEECVRLAPDWPKAFARRGAAEARLTRWASAQTSYRRALELDPGNAQYEKALEDAKAGEAQQTKERIAEEKRREELEEMKKRKAAADAAKAREEEREKAALADFFGVLEDDKAAKAKKERQKTNPTTEKYTKQKLGKGKDHIARLTERNASFKNLNPFRVLQLDTDATPDDIKHRYRKLSALCHPDKHGGEEVARQAFEYIKDAHNQLLDGKKRDRAILVVEGARERARLDRQLQIDKGVDEEALPSLEACQEKQVLKTFAENEMKRRDVEEHKRVQQQRERDQAAEAEKKEADEKKFEQQWNDDDRRGERVGHWQDFQDDKARQSNVKRQRGAVQFKKRDEKPVKKQKYGEWQKESWR